MSKPQSATQAKPQSKQEGQRKNPDREQVPDRAVGLIIMCLAIVFVAVWMALQSPQQIDSETTQLSSLAQAPITGFLANAWFLPDEQLLGFVQIPAGPFTMGSNPALDRLAYENERWSSSRRQGTVQIDDF